MTGNVTWLSPAACDPGKQAAGMAGGTRSDGQAMRVLVTEDDEVLATALAAGLRREGVAVDVALDGDAAGPFTSTVKTTIGRLRAKLGDPPVIETVRESGYRIGGP